ncbi:MAG: methyltransferase domain-containing protein [Polyangiales bacterium]
MDLREIPQDARTGPSRRHPWEVARAAFFEALVGPLVAARPCRVLDVGAGDAFVGAELAASFGERVVVTCVDPGYATLGRPACAGVRLLDRIPEERFDLLLLLDVLEHVEDDLGLLSDLVRSNLGDGAHVLVSVPAWPGLYARHDRALGHHRRYRPRELHALLSRAGLERLEGGGLFHSLVLPRAATVLAERLRGDAAEVGAPPPLEWRKGPVVTGAVSTALGLDNRVSRLASRLGLGLPGLSEWALARVPTRAR